jgi:4-diphosphocytidyl-2-C-methyl-D-erythritol kinase
MVVFPNCKLNIGLNILEKRDDGFHNLETIFYPVPLTDALEVIRANDDTGDVLFSQTGNHIGGNIQDNLCVKAWHFLKKDFPQLPAIQMHLHKAIPMGAGLGGGSADGAFAIKLLNEKFNLGLSNSQLISYSLQLGSDCPFFIINQPCYASGRGERLQPVELSLAGYQLVLINPGIHINTGGAFAQLKNEPASNRLSKGLLQAIQQPIAQWKHSVSNDFEATVFAAHPPIQQIKETLYRQGAVYAAMSGSGSSVYGLFDHYFDADGLFPDAWFVKSILL